MTSADRPPALPKSEVWPTHRWEYLLPVAAAVALGFLTPGFVEIVRDWGHRIQEPRVERGYLAALLWAPLLTVGIVFWPVRLEDKPRLLLLWTIKLGVTLGFMLFYENRFGLDAFLYSEAAQSAEAPSAPGGTGAIITLSWWLNVLGPDSYHALKLTYSYIGLVAVYVFYRAAEIATAVTPRLLYLLALFPSILFWSSTLGKDPIVFLGIALATFGSMGVIRGHGRAHWIILLAGVALASWIRPWMAPLLLAPIGVVTFFGTWSWGRRIVVLGVLAIGILMVRERIASRIPVVASKSAIATLRQIARDEASWRGGSSRRPPEFGSVAGLVAYVPVAGFTAVFRPLPGEVRNPFGMLSGLESVVLLTLLGLALKRSRWRDVGDPAVLWALVFVAVWGVFYGLTVYNFGALVRFKLQILPVVLCLLVYLARHRPDADHTSVSGA